MVGLSSNFLTPVRPVCLMSAFNFILFEAWNLVIARLPLRHDEEEAAAKIVCVSVLDRMGSLRAAWL